MENKEPLTEDPPAASADAISADEVDQLRIERDGLKSERNELKDLLLRRQAEFDNFRKRTERERSDYLQYAGMDFVREMLPVLDDFDRALRTECASPEYAKGVQMIRDRMYDALTKLGLEPFDAVGQTFDPHVHQAVERVETKDAGEGAVLEEFQRGYRFKGKLLRPSMVKVAVRS